MTESIGKVYLLGAGPGSVAYLTLRGQQLLNQAEVLVYDALVDPQLFKLVPTNCRQFDVGKRGGSPSTPQSEINQLLVEQCQQGKQVVRLKSGDPFIFGRATSEIQALIAATCPFEVVPGISSALVAPLLADIPLTDSVLSKCFAVLTAHHPEELDWETLARIDTLSILMGGRHLDTIVRQLQRYGRSPQTPIAVIRACGRPEQQVWVGTLADIFQQTAGVSLSPVVIVVGEVVNLRNYLGNGEWGMGNGERAFHLPLAALHEESKVQSSTRRQLSTQRLKGKTVLVTRSADQSSKFRDLLECEGATVIEMPALVITPPSSWEALDRAIANLSDFDWLILTSSNGVESFFERLLTQGKDTRTLAGVKIAVVGKKTAANLKERGLKPDFIPPDFVADSLVEHFPESLTYKKVLFPRVETGGREVLLKELTARGADIVEVAAYQSACPEQIAPVAFEALQRKAVDIITFASSKTVKNFYYLLEEALKDKGDVTPHSLLENLCIASIGPQTSKSCYELLGRVDVEAEEYTLEGLTQAIARR
ncbi:MULTISPECIES: uroporphyrinogen-III C-methyltransferase [unclassified Coleofasciculus]|uniref:uroporphyrinogen-III C-methyltransferase n=1 Tax=unclassified Coleofasciculus TaxID=2692782 RepID=UPI0018822232|nr:MULTISPECIES: uroporphyrinogen-III C-methyltransferase [unclassified Coleofasciculus]MBE9124912.1 uroporphyrinogen-III C-methyltransferase [Coleofasciculus sp. LEGE 07081]MBE9147843.1 uroporphyrinogen-III C-methyltransferase [Coleofasciculus sp. LEGE 07092]